MILAVYRGSTVTNRRRRIGSVQLPSSAVVYRDSPSCLRVLPWAIRDSLRRLPYRLRQFPYSSRRCRTETVMRPCSSVMWRRRTTEDDSFASVVLRSPHRESVIAA